MKRRRRFLPADATSVAGSSRGPRRALFYETMHTRRSGPHFRQYLRSGIDRIRSESTGIPAKANGEGCQSLHRHRKTLGSSSPDQRNPARTRPTTRRRSPLHQSVHSRREPSSDKEPSSGNSGPTRQISREMGLLWPVPWRLRSDVLPAPKELPASKAWPGGESGADCCLECIEHTMVYRLTFLAEVEWTYGFSGRVYSHGSALQSLGGTSKSFWRPSPSCDGILPFEGGQRSSACLAIARRSPVAAPARVLSPHPEGSRP
jgi:hypothetical protein